MTLKTKLAFDLDALGRPKSSSMPPNPAAGPAALAVAVALLRALKDRGMLSQGELDEILADAQWRTVDPKARQLLDGVRADLERGESE